MNTCSTSSSPPFLLPSSSPPSPSSLFLSPSSSALLIVDLQNDFITGSLKVPNAIELIPRINDIRHSNSFQAVIFTMDWHPKDHVSFACNHVNGKEFENNLWPIHCLQHTIGSAFPSSLLTTKNDIIIRKGTLSNVEMYSGFGDENEHTGLEQILKEIEIKKLFVGGLVLEICVKETILDALKLGYEVFLIEDASQSFDAQKGSNIKEELQKFGVKIIQSFEIKNYLS